MKTEFPELLTARPEGMTFKEYKEKRSEQNKLINARIKKGRLCFVAVQMVNVGSIDLPKWVRTKAKYNRTFKGNVYEDLIKPKGMS